MVQDRDTQIIDSERESEAWLEKIQFLSDAMESTSQPFCACDRDGSILVFNEAFCRLTGYTRKELVKINWVTDLTLPESLEKEYRVLRVLEKTHQPQRYEKSCRRKDDTIVPVEILVNFAPDSKGQPLFYYFLITDMTRRKQAEEVMRESEEKFRTLAETASVGIMLFREDKYIYTNPYMQKILGYTGEELLAMNFWEVVHPDFRELARIRVRERLQGIQVPSRYEIKVITKDKKTRWGEYSAEVIRYDGKPTVIGIFYDITDRKLTEEALRESEFDLKKAQEIAHLGNWALDVDTGELTGSLENDRIFGFEPGGGPRNIEMVRSRVHPDDLSIMDNFLADVTRDGRRESIEYRIVKPDGSLRYLNTIADKVDRDESGKIKQVYGITQDITGHKKAEEEIRAEKSFSDAIIDTIPGIFYMFDDRNRFVRMNKNMLTVLEYTPDELLSLDVLDVVAEQDRDQIIDAFQEISKKGYVTRIANLLTRTKKQIPYLLSGYSTQIHGKRYLIGIGIDVTDKVKAEKALRESEEMFRAFAESAKAEIVLIKGNRFIYVNPERVRALGYTKEELMAMKVEDTIHPDMREIVRDRVRRRLQGEPVPSQYEARMITKSGETYWEEISSTVIDYKGEPTILSMGFNITARKRAEQALKEAKMQAELYLDLMSHDITNMNQALMGNLELLDMLSETGEIDKGLITSSIEIINRSTRTIRDVKKLTQIQAGNVPQKVVNVCEILDNVKSKYSKVPGRSVTITYAPGANCLVMAGDMLEDVFDNLVDNAIRHSQIAVTIDLTIDQVLDKGITYLRIDVSDNGPGIPDELKKTILMTPEELEGKSIRRGFGLYLVRTLVDYYHGKVWAEDRVPGDYMKGARFVVLLPAAEK
ncbi:PAS domain S-box protein [Methanocella arvoryzae]|uniref:histidine kinase n=1 Tax=Methanocella arvoryzae (strain DSM 22066 / NBRC 105507 / MRE50) TaxID=351160 RepID=Q0W107_METAR|nr:PAS domain S-box protein [Methanocella arvoryzae]CAJ37936.1 putative signal transduction histidine kinase [Methanocella arvoryzae MRE50]